MEKKSTGHRYWTEDQEIKARVEQKIKKLKARVDWAISSQESSDKLHEMLGFILHVRWDLSQF